MPLYCSFVGWSGSGKTTLLRTVISGLAADGLQVAAIKATHHDVRLDTPGKDSHCFAESGAQPVAIAAAGETTVFLPSDERTEDRLRRLLEDAEIVIGESRTFSEGLRFEVASGVGRLEGLKQPLHELDALVSDEPELTRAAREAGLAVFGRSQGAEVAAFIRKHYEAFTRSAGSGFGV